MKEQAPARVLIAEDNEPIRRLAEVLLRRDGYLVDCVTNGSEAIDRLSAENYSLVLLDLMMPGKSGFNVLEYLEESSSTAGGGTHVLVLTAASDRVIESAGGVNVCRMLRKPFDLEELSAAIEACVRSEHAPRQWHSGVSDDVPGVTP